MKEYCEKCDGTGEIDYSTIYENDTRKCSYCQGKGYNELDIYKYTYSELQEIERKAAVYDEVLKTAIQYAVDELDVAQAMIKIADIVDAWVE